MGLTLSQYKAYMADAVSQKIVDEVVGGKSGSAQFLSQLPFTSNAALTRTGNQMAWTYRYYRREYQRALAVRTVGNEYTPAQVQAPVAYTVDLSIFGGSFEFDRVMKNASDIADFYAEQLQALSIAVPPKMLDLIINGDASVTGEFDGLDIILTGSTTEANSAAHIDVSTAANIETNFEAFRLKLDQWLSSLLRMPDVLLVNSQFKPIFTAIARKSGMYTLTADEFGRNIETYGTIPFLAAGEVDGATTQIIPVETRDYGSGNVTGLTDIYGICYGDDQFHGVAPSDKTQLIQIYEPNLELPGVVKTGELEVLATAALENTKAAGVFRNVKIA